VKPISESVRRFVLTCLPSVAHLEAALYFLRRGPLSSDVQEVGLALYLADPVAKDVLDDLTACGVLQRDEARYRYGPNSDELARAMQGLLQCYHDDLIGLTHLIHDATQRKAQRFADAFKLRKDP
jgi:hypothetical protein